MVWQQKKKLHNTVLIINLKNTTYHMKRIVKVIYENNEVVELPPIKPLNLSNIENTYERYKIRKAYNKQFQKFEEAILENLDPDTVEEFAKENFDLISEDDVEDKTINYFNDDEILEEVNARQLFFKQKTSIISSHFLDRFLLIMEKENQIKLDEILSNIEKKP